MRYSIFFLIFLLIFCCQTASAQGFQIECAMTEGMDEPSQSQTFHYEGKHITSTGTLRVLVIFVRFADDNETSTIWPNPSVLPTWAQNFVNTNYSASGNYYPGTVSHYFYQNSYGNLHIIGDVYFVTTDNNEEYYHIYAENNTDDAARGLIEMEALNKLDNAPYNVDFSIYDNWKRLGQYNIDPGQDGEVDMIWFITRNLQITGLPNGQARFDIGRATLDCSTHSRDGKTIRGNGNFPGSGVSMFMPHMYWPINSSQEPYGNYSIVNHVAHEMSHYFFGSGHFADLPKYITSNRYGSSMKTYAGGWRSVYSGYEKWRLGWMQPKTITVNGDNYNLYDLATTMKDPSGSTNDRLFKIDIPGTGQYYLIENRRWTSPFEARYAVNSGPYGLLKPGILIYHIIYDSDNVPSVKVKKADPDGRFKWKMIYHGPNTGSSYDAIRDDYLDKDIPDRANGYTETERIYITGYPGEWWHATWHPSSLTPYGGGPYKCTYSQGGIHETTDLNGDSLDIFKVGDVLTPWSNTASHKWNGASFSATTIGVEMSSFNSTNQYYTLKVRLSNPEQLAPSKPQSLNVENYNSHPKLSWEANLEPDLDSYIIERNEWGGNWYQIGTTTNTFFVDNDVFINPPYFEDMVEYQVKAKDTDNKVSLPSNKVVVEDVAVKKKDIDLTEITSFNLSQNYPNPFNPTTKITFILPEDARVVLKVYDILGREAAVLVDEYMSKGMHEISFDGTELSSGVYFYRIVAIKEEQIIFSDAKTMVLLK